MKVIAILIFTIFCSNKSVAMTCVSFLNSKTDVFSKIEKLDPDEQFEQLLMVARSAYDIKTFDFATSKYERFFHLKNTRLDDQGARLLMTLFLKHSFTHLPAEVITLGREALENLPFRELSEDEKTALALTHLFPKESRDSQKVIAHLAKLNTPRSKWHLAETHYMIGEFEDSLKVLYQIESDVGHLSSKSQEAVRAVLHKMSGGLFTDRAEESSFDNTQWGAFEL